MALAGVVSLKWGNAGGRTAKQGVWLSLGLI